MSIDLEFSIRNKKTPNEHSSFYLRFITWHEQWAIQWRFPWMTENKVNEKWGVTKRPYISSLFLGKKIYMTRIYE